VGEYTGQEKLETQWKKAWGKGSKVAKPDGQRITCDECVTSIADMHVGCGYCKRELCIKCFLHMHDPAAVIKAAEEAAAKAAEEAAAKAAEEMAAPAPAPADIAAAHGGAEGNGLSVAQSSMDIDQPHHQLQTSSDPAAPLMPPQSPVVDNHGTAQPPVATLTRDGIQPHQPPQTESAAQPISSGSSPPLPISTSPRFAAAAGWQRQSMKSPHGDPVQAPEPRQSTSLQPSDPASFVQHPTSIPPAAPATRPPAATPRPPAKPGPVCCKRDGSDVGCGKPKLELRRFLPSKDTAKLKKTLEDWEKRAPPPPVRFFGKANARLASPSCLIRAVRGPLSRSNEPGSLQAEYTGLAGVCPGLPHPWGATSCRKAAPLTHTCSLTYCSDPTATSERGGRGTCVGDC